MDTAMTLSLIVNEFSVPTSAMLHAALCPHMLTYLWSSTSFSSASLL